MIYICMIYVYVMWVGVDVVCYVMCVCVSVDMCVYGCDVCAM